MVEMVEIISTWAPPKVEMVEIASKSCDFIVNNNIKIQKLTISTSSDSNL